MTVTRLEAVKVTPSLLSFSKLRMLTIRRVSPTWCRRQSHSPPTKCAVSPVSALTVLSLPPAKNPSACPSGAQNGYEAPSVPAILYKDQSGTLVKRVGVTGFAEHAVDSRDNFLRQFAAEFNIHAAPCHVGGDGHRAERARARRRCGRARRSRRGARDGRTAWETAIWDQLEPQGLTVLAVRASARLAPRFDRLWGTGALDDVDVKDED